MEQVIRSSLKGLAVCRELYWTVFMESWLERKGNDARATGLTAKSRTSQGAECGWSQCFRSCHRQTSSEVSSEASYLGEGRKELDCCLVAQIPLLRWKQILPFIWKSRSQNLKEEWRRTECRFPQSVVIWGAMSFARPLCFIKSKINAAVHQEVLPFAGKLYGDADYLFQQDLTPAHSAKTATNCTVLDWPANSPNLNPMENLWTQQYR